MSKFTIYQHLNDIADSMYFDSGTEIASYETDNGEKYKIDVSGRVRVKDMETNKMYYHASEMPKWMRQEFRNGTAFKDDRIYIILSNWYEIYNEIDPYEDIYIEEDLENASDEDIKELMQDFAKGCEYEYEEDNVR